MFEHRIVNNQAQATPLAHELQGTTLGYLLAALRLHRTADERARDAATPLWWKLLRLAVAIYGFTILWPMMWIILSIPIGMLKSIYSAGGRWLS